MKGGAEGARGARRHAPRIRAVAVPQAKQKCPLGRRGARGNPAARAGTAQDTFAAVVERVAAVSVAGARGMAPACGRAIERPPADWCLPPSEPRRACGRLGRDDSDRRRRMNQRAQQARWRNGKGERRPCEATARHPPHNRRASRTKVPFRAEGESEETPQRARAPRKTRARMPRG